jgi:hypothetical protein
MNGFVILFSVVTAVLLLALPRRWAAVPLLAGTCYMTLGQAVEVGPLHFTVIRMLIAVGLLRVILRGERLAGGMNSLDLLMLVWAVWALFASLFFANAGAALVNRLGLVYNACGIYLLFRAFCREPEDAFRLCRSLAVLLAPLAAAMLVESLTQYNVFSALTDSPLLPEVRNGRVRAHGAFSHAILAGTVGACSLPLMAPLWRTERKAAVLGIAACAVMVITSRSSGPILSAAAGLGALGLWHYRERLGLLRWLAVVSYVGLDLLMKAPAYYLISRIDLTGGSTGWHRARLIESAFEHLSEWWLAGTDYTKHWMPTGVDWSGDHTDITNHYLNLGVVGGLPFMLLFIAVLATAFSYVGQALRQAPSKATRFLLWALGASLFAHSATFISVSYFDQSFVFLYLTLAAIGSYPAAAAGTAGQRFGRFPGSQAPAWRCSAGPGSA